jgi:hypothetical protein
MTDAFNKQCVENMLRTVCDGDFDVAREALFETNESSDNEIIERVLELIDEGRHDYVKALMLVLGATANPKVFDGFNSTSLSESVQQYMSPNGLTFTGATDIGVNYTKERNEDRVSLQPKQGFAAVVDGLGARTEAARSRAPSPSRSACTPATCRPRYERCKRFSNKTA